MRRFFTSLSASKSLFFKPSVHSPLPRLRSATNLLEGAPFKVLPRALHQSLRAGIFLKSLPARSVGEKLQQSIIPVDSARATVGVQFGEALFQAFTSETAQPTPVSGFEECRSITLGDTLLDISGFDSLFLRPFYDPFIQGILCNLDPSAFKMVRKFIILGNPGIGKSSFGLYLVYRALREKRTVVYASSKVSFGWVFEPSGKVTCFDPSPSELRQLPALYDRSAFFICDSLPPPVVRAITILITSPRRDRWYEFSKELNCQELFFPVFSWKEMEALRISCYPDRTLADVSYLYSKWGGIPRYVLGKPKYQSDPLLDSAVSQMNIDRLQPELTKTQISDLDFSHRVLHLKTRGEDDSSLDRSTLAFYQSSNRVEFASQWVANTVYDRCMTMDRGRMSQLLSAALDLPDMGLMCGPLFQAHALRCLLKGGNFQAFQLHSDRARTPTDFKLPDKIKCRQFYESLPRKVGGTLELLHPYSKSFCSVDFILSDGRFLQATINQHHTIKLTSNKTDQGLLPLARSLNIRRNEDIHFFWLVPASRLDQWHSPQPLLKQSKVVPARDRSRSRVKQYVVSIPV